MLTPKQKLIKRGFDLILVLIALVPAIFLSLLLGLLATLSLKTWGWFSQKRVGLNGATFCLFKIRTLKGSSHSDVVAIKAAETRFGNWLRTTKLDEIPQVFNVLMGDMSWVGPRPDIPGYADLLQGEDRIVLSVRPGITGPATLKYKNEESILWQQANPLAYNDEVIWPDKVHINKAYVQNWSLAKDIGYLWRSIF
jgi:lipopolysaccharide/colanic/teichoic acid biosynthesis glycosyltransferase